MTTFADHSQPDWLWSIGELQMSSGPVRMMRSASLLLVGVWPAVGQPVTGVDDSVERPEIVMLGQLDLLEMYKAAEEIRDADLGEVAIGIEDVTASTDLVLVSVSSIDGPMPATREAVASIEGRDDLRVAILQTGTDQVADAELLQLVRLESLDLLREFGFRDVAVLQLPHPDFIATVQLLLGSAPDDPPPDLIVTIPPPPTAPEQSEMPNLAGIPWSSAVQWLGQELGWEVIAVSVGNFGHACDPLISDQAPPFGTLVDRGTQVLIAINVDEDVSSTPNDTTCPFWEAMPYDEYEALVAEVESQPGVHL